MLAVPLDINLDVLWQKLAQTLEEDVVQPTITRVKDNRLMIEFSWQKNLHSGDRRDRRYGCSSRLKVYNKTAESVLSRGSHDKFGTGMYNYMYNSDK